MLTLPSSIPFFVTEEINKLEQKFLELLQYNVTVKSALYAKYYFELRALFQNESDFGIKRLDDDEAKALESRSAKFKEKYEKNAKSMSMTTYNLKER